MQIKRAAALILFILLFSASTLPAAEGISPFTMEKYRQVKASLEQMTKAKAGIYARDILDGVQRNLARAQEGIDAKSEKTASQALNMALLQIEQAKAKAEEKEAAEKTAVMRAKVDKLEQRLANILAGKGEEK
jgi:transcription termination factor NusB